MENEHKSFVFYSSYYDAIKSFDPDTQLKLIEAIAAFAFENKEPDLTGVANTVFELIRPTITASMARYQICVENGKKGGKFGHLGGAPLGNQNARKQPKTTPKTTPKQPLNYNYNENEKENSNYNFNSNFNCNENFNSNDNFNDNENKNEKENYNERENENLNYNYNFNETEKNFSLSLSLSQNEIQAFKNAFPNRKLDLDKLPAITIPPNFDMFALIQHIKQSTFLSSANNMGLASCIKNYDSIVGGNYDNFTKPQAPSPKESWELQYSPADLDTLFDKVEDIEV